MPTPSIPDLILERAVGLLPAALELIKAPAPVVAVVRAAADALLPVLQGMVRSSLESEPLPELRQVEQPADEDVVLEELERDTLTPEVLDPRSNR